MSRAFHKRFARIAVLILSVALLTTELAQAATIKVVTSGAFTAAYLELVSQYERGHAYQA